MLGKFRTSKLSKLLTHQKKLSTLSSKSSKKLNRIYAEYVSLNGVLIHYTWNNLYLDTSYKSRTMKIISFIYVSSDLQFIEPKVDDIHCSILKSILARFASMKVWSADNQGSNVSLTVSFINDTSNCHKRTLSIARLDGGHTEMIFRNLFYMMHVTTKLTKNLFRHDRRFL